jgi:hypothetical protein
MSNFLEADVLSVNAGNVSQQTNDSGFGIKFSVLSANIANIHNLDNTQ